MKIAPDLLEQIAAHAHRDAPNECVGIVLAREGTAYEVVPLENRQASPRSFDVDPLEVFNRSSGTEDLGAIYHSHVRSAPEPSQTDINYGVNWPGVEWIIVGLKDAVPEFRSWLIESSGDVREVVLE